MATSVKEGAAGAVGGQSEATTLTVIPAAAAPVAATEHSQKGWRYSETGKRDLRLDLLRGFAVFAMVVDHIGGASWLYLLSGGNRFFVSAAEVFVFISGLMVGLIYTDRARRDGFRATAPKLLKRAWTLYALAVWLALATAFAAALFDLPRGVILGESPARFIFEVLTLQRTFYLVDVMLFYAFAMLVAPLALGALMRGGWWLVGLCSAALWGAYQVWPAALQLPWVIADNPVFNFAAWQILFFGGMLIGSWREARERAGVGLRPVPSRLSLLLRELALPAFAVALGGLIYVHFTNGRLFAPYIAESDTGAWLDRWFDKSALPFPRLLACVIVFGFLWLLVTRCWRVFRKGLGWFLVPLGQGALYAYASHLFVIIVVQIGILQIWGRGRESGYSAPSMAYDTLIQLLGVLAVWGLTRARFLQQIVAPLGNAPFITFRLPKLQWRLPRPSDSLAAILVVCLLCLPFLYPLGIGGGVTLRSGTTTAANPTVAPPAGQTSAPSSGAKGGAAPVSTVTAPRSVGGSARGSAGYTGRNDQPGASVAPTAAARSGSTGAQPRVQPTALPTADAGGAVPTTQGVSGGYLKDDAFFSQALGRTMPYGIYLPPTYDSDPNRRYPVVYMLHGAGGHYSEWVAYGLPETAENLIWDGQIQPLIIVMPQGDHSYFVNHAGTDEERWGDYIAFDLIAYIDSMYRTIPQPSSRAIGGLSMGGFGALQLAFSHPDIFGAVGAHSPALRTVEQLSDILDPTDAPEEFDPIEAAKAINPTYAPRIWVDAGADDEWADRVVLLGQTLDERGITHEVRVTPGEHTGDYWTARAGDYIRFYARSVVGDNLGLGRAP